MTNEMTKQEMTAARLRAATDGRREPMTMYQVNIITHGKLIVVSEDVEIALRELGHAGAEIDDYWAEGIDDDAFMVTGADGLDCGALKAALERDTGATVDVSKV